MNTKPNSYLQSLPTPKSETGSPNSAPTSPESYVIVLNPDAAWVSDGLGRRMVQIRLRDIIFDLSVQREPDRNHVRNIVSRFDPMAFGILAMVEIDGRLICIDGQHRTLAAIERGFGDSLVWCSVGLCPDVETAARWFTDLQKQKAAGPEVIQRVGETAKDPVALRVREALDANGMTLDAKSRVVTSVRAYEQVREITLKRGNLEAVLRTVREWQRLTGATDNSATTARWLRGISIVLARGDVTPEKLAETVAEVATNHVAITKGSWYLAEKMISLLKPSRKRS